MYIHYNGKQFWHNTVHTIRMVLLSVLKQHTARSGISLMFADPSKQNNAKHFKTLTHAILPTDHLEDPVCLQKLR